LAINPVWALNIQLNQNLPDVSCDYPLSIHSGKANLTAAIIFVKLATTKSQESGVVITHVMLWSLTYKNLYWLAFFVRNTLFIRYLAMP